jgi:uncharacterized membrane protein
MLSMTNFAAAVPADSNGARARRSGTMSGLMQAVTVGGAVGAGTIGGVFFAFSGFVMPALRRLPAAQGISAMQSINRTAVAPPLMLALFGTAIISGITITWAARSWPEPAAPWMLAGGLAYLTAVVITAAANVPLNNSLAGLDPAGPGAQAHWAAFLSHWTLWNHLRGAAALAGALACVIALIRR